MKNRIATIAATLAAPVLAAAVLAGPASARPAVPAQIVTSTFCNTPALPWTQWQACVTVKASGSHVYWARGSFRVYPVSKFTGFGTLTLAGFYASTGTFSVPGRSAAVGRTASFNVGRNIAGGTRICATLRTTAGTVRAQWCGPMSDFGQNPRR